MNEMNEELKIMNDVLHDICYTLSCAAETISIILAAEDIAPQEARNSAIYAVGELLRLLSMNIDTTT